MSGAGPGTQTDPRLQVIVDALGSAGSSEAMPHDQLQRFAEETLADLDMHSPDPTVRRLQRELHEAWGNDVVDWNLARAMQIVTDIDICRGVVDALKRAFKSEELDGGWRTALSHPLYVSTEARIASLEDELRGLI